MYNKVEKSIQMYRSRNAEKEEILANDENIQEQIKVGMLTRILVTNTYLIISLCLLAIYAICNNHLGLGFLGLKQFLFHLYNSEIVTYFCQ